MQNTIPKIKALKYISQNTNEKDRKIHQGELKEKLEEEYLMKNLSVIFEERAAKITNNEKKRESLIRSWQETFEGVTCNNHNLQTLFVLYLEDGEDIGKATINVKRCVVSRRTLNPEEILKSIHEAEKQNDILKLIEILQTTFLEYMNETVLTFVRKRMLRQGWSWQTLLKEYINNGQRGRAFSCLNIPYEKYEKRLGIA